MLASKKTRRGVIGAVVLAGVLAVSGYALTNTATVYDSYAGDGTGNVDQVTVHNIHYDIDTTTTNPSIDKVHFTVAEPIATNATVYAQLEDGAGGVVTGGNFIACAQDATPPGGASQVLPNGSNTDSTWVCDFTSTHPVVSAVKSLHAVVAD